MESNRLRTFWLMCLVIGFIFDSTLAAASPAVPSTKVRDFRRGRYAKIESVGLSRSRTTVYLNLSERDKGEVKSVALFFATSEEAVSVKEAFEKFRESKKDLDLQPFKTFGSGSNVGGKWRLAVTISMPQVSENTPSQDPISRILDYLKSCERGLETL